MSRLWLALVMVLFLAPTNSAPSLRMVYPAECHDCLMVYYVEWSTNLINWHFAFRYEGSGDYGELNTQFPATQPFRFHRVTAFFKVN